jgi:hypothetical protein
MKKTKSASMDIEKAKEIILKERQQRIEEVAKKINELQQAHEEHGRMTEEKIREVLGDEFHITTTQQVTIRDI